jgi:hypothetical protein
MATVTVTVPVIPGSEQYLTWSDYLLLGTVPETIYPGSVTDGNPATGTTILMYPPANAMPHNCEVTVDYEPFAVPAGAVSAFASVGIRASFPVVWRAGTEYSPEVDDWIGQPPAYGPSTGPGCQLIGALEALPRWAGLPPYNLGVYGSQWLLGENLPPPDPRWGSAPTTTLQGHYFDVSDTTHLAAWSVELPLAAASGYRLRIGTVDYIGTDDIPFDAVMAFIAEVTDLTIDFTIPDLLPQSSTPPLFQVQRSGGMDSHACRARQRTTRQSGLLQRGML